jgi:Family of unknown function (DUF6174)
VSAGDPASLNQQPLQAAKNLWGYQNMEHYQWEYDQPGTASSSFHPWIIAVDTPNTVMARDVNYNQVHGILVPNIDQPFTLIQTEIDTNTDEDIL